MKPLMVWSRLLALTWVLVSVQAHGMLSAPPNRASIWRYGYDSPRDVDDNGMNCGGFSRHHIFNSGKCGICGDPYDEKQPRAHELGGKFGIGYIVAHYKKGQIISTKVDLNAAHRGYWELRICPTPYNQQQECFDNGYLLETVDGETKYYPQRGSTFYYVNYRLPADLTCKHCVLQWHYTAGNSGGFCGNGTRAVGCGQQEQFYSCSDIAIEENVPNYEWMKETEVKHRDRTVPQDRRMGILRTF